VVGIFCRQLVSRYLFIKSSSHGGQLHAVYYIQQNYFYNHPIL
jgi:hypothetical protein